MCKSFKFRPTEIIKNSAHKLMQQGQEHFGIMHMKVMNLPASRCVRTWQEPPLNKEVALQHQK